MVLDQFFKRSFFLEFYFLRLYDGYSPLPMTPFAATATPVEKKKMSRQMVLEDSGLFKVTNEYQQSCRLYIKYMRFESQS